MVALVVDVATLSTPPEVSMLVGGATISAPGSLTGMGELAELSHLLLDQSPQLDEAKLREQVNHKTENMNACEQPAKVTLNSATMPQNMTWDYGTSMRCSNKSI